MSNIQNSNAAIMEAIKDYPNVSEGIISSFELKHALTTKLEWTDS